jgi:TRAP-type mannitol/chloroaromatic compound transport system permease large subunit
MSAMGLAMLVLLAILILQTGLPVWALLIGVSTLFALAGMAHGVISVGLLTAAPTRIVGLLEHDLLQALPLYVLVGVLLQRLAVGDAVFATLESMFAKLGAKGAATPLAALSTGALIAPMNGSVASSASLLARLVAPRLQHARPAKATALVAAAATVGVVVPPSLVLLLLGDAMMRAHTEASNLPGYVVTGQRIINTQDVLNAALLPAALVLLAWMAVVAITARSRMAAEPLPRVQGSQILTAVVAIAVIASLLSGVFIGKLFAVEAAAAGGCLLIGLALATRKLNRAAWQQVLSDTLSLTGALFALLVGATVFSLVFRGWGTDRWLADLLLSGNTAPATMALCILLGVMACAWVLDAFEMIFVIIPIVAPALVLRLGDAQQAAVLLLLVLQVSFLLPPMGYAVLMARSRSGFAATTNWAVGRYIAPYAVIIMGLAAAVWANPRLVHQLDKPQTATRPMDAASEADIVQQMQEMGKQEPAGAKTPAP